MLLLVIRTLRLAAATYEVGGLRQMLHMFQVEAPLQDVGIAFILLAKGVLARCQAIVQQQPKGEDIHCKGKGRVVQTC